MSEQTPGDPGLPPGCRQSDIDGPDTLRERQRRMIEQDKADDAAGEMEYEESKN